MRRSQVEYVLGYLGELGELLKERALEVKQNLKEAKGSEEYNFQSGRLLAYYEVISTMQHLAEGFGIPLAELRLEDIDPDRDLI